MTDACGQEITSASLGDGDEYLDGPDRIEPPHEHSKHVFLGEGKALVSTVCGEGSTPDLPPYPSAERVNTQNKTKVGVPLCDVNDAVFYNTPKGVSTYDAPDEVVGAQPTVHLPDSHRALSRLIKNIHTACTHANT